GAAGRAGRALATEHLEAEGVPGVRQVVAAHAPGTSDAARAVAQPRNVEERGGKARDGVRAEVARATPRVQARHEQDLRAQVVAHAGEEGLVEQQSAERAAAEARIAQPRGDRVRGE